ncbi:Probable acyl-CoA dehydrogenase [Mycobacteroides abscessus subsp. abscessus]|nr:Probable acyl-CoA dehydrogenase [Mycobacteroides abscessus subsp. abscessus]
MAINLELPKKLQAIVEKGHQGAAELVRPISRKYDLAEHAYPVELETLETLFAGVTAAGTFAFAGAEACSSSNPAPRASPSRRTPAWVSAVRRWAG